jgi:hypothetical protein
LEQTINLSRLTLVLLLLTPVAAWSVLAGLEYAHPDEDANYAQIEEGLYMGGVVRRPPPGTRAVLNLCERADSYGAEHFVWQPIRDAEPTPDVDWLRRMVQWIDTERQAGRITYVHCRNGVSRSGFVVVAYVMAKNGWTRDRALAFVRSRRPETRPNPAFRERLAEWERIMLASRPGKKDSPQ